MQLSMSYRTCSPSITETSENGYSWYECNCCPYGYHIDLDFVRYCESISKETDNRTGSIQRRRDRRRQRQSMEVLLGLIPPVIPPAEETYKTIEEQKDQSPNPSKTKATKFPFLADEFDDAVSDFERTLQRSKNKLSNNLPDVTAVSENSRRFPLTSGATSTSEAPKRLGFDGAAFELSSMSPMALQNVRKQMALGLERTKLLEDQVKMVPELKEQVKFLEEENRRLLNRLQNEQKNKENLTNGNYIEPQHRQRSLSFTTLNNANAHMKKESSPPPPPPPRKDFGVMCSVLTRNVGVGHQTPHTKNASIGTEFSDKWLHEKLKFLNDVQKATASKNTQTAFQKHRDVGVQFKHDKPAVSKFNAHVQTEPKTLIDKGVSVKSKLADFAVQKCVECSSVGCSDDTVNDVVCDKCNAIKASVAVGPDSNQDSHTSPISLASLTSRSKSFNMGEDRLNFSTRTRTVASQYEPNNINRASQVEIRKPSSTKACQFEPKKTDKCTQYEKHTISRHTDTQELIVVKKHVGCEAREKTTEVVDRGCDAATEAVICAKCEKEREVWKKDGGSPTPSRIPRLQLPTNNVETRKLKRQDTYTKVYTPISEKLPTTQAKLSGLDLPSKVISNDADPLDNVKSNLKLDETNVHAQNGVASTPPITKVQVHEITLPISESTIFQPNADQNRKKVVPSKEMQGAMKVLNDSLMKNPSKKMVNHSAINIVQTEWFKISSQITANPLDVEDYLDALEDMSSLLLEYVVNMSDSSGNTAMHYAVSHGNFDVVSILLDSKVCDINKPNKAGYTSVMLVSLAEVRSQTHANVVRRLFQLADVNIRAKQHGQTALMLAVSHGRLDMVKMLLEAGADINIQDEDGSTALMCAAEHGHIEIVKHFLSQPDCDSTITDVDGSTALKIAMEAGHRHIGVPLYAHERNMQKHNPKLKKKSIGSPKTPSSPLAVRSGHRALMDLKSK
ncbi:unnamed protein product [Phyllotreta striolata]|nr:unnamed protein product [Phyllotreta striolata]